MFILDCSITVSWCFEDQASNYADRTLDLLTKTEALVPSLWPLEVANVLLVAERKQRITEAESLRFINLLRTLPISVDDQTSACAVTDTLSLARRLKISSYDAAYLELAVRLGLPLATLDEILRNRAFKMGVVVGEELFSRYKD
jgi:predicted nucleic acid-binding protein